MTELQRYLAEEVAEDHADGIITRREAMRRLGPARRRRGHGLRAAHRVHRHGGRRGAGGVTRPAAGSPRTTRWTSGRRWRPRRSPSPAPAARCIGAWAAAEDPRGAVLVIHENRGLTDHIRSVAGRFAASGYSALAIDLLSEEGGTGAFPGEAEVAAALAAAPPGALRRGHAGGRRPSSSGGSRARRSARSASASAAAWCGACSPPGEDRRRRGGAVLRAVPGRART